MWHRGAAQPVRAPAMNTRRRHDWYVVRFTAPVEKRGEMLRMTTRSDELSEQRDCRAHEDDASAEDAYDVPQEQQNDAQCTCGRARKRGRGCAARRLQRASLER